MAAELKHWLDAHGTFIEDKNGPECEVKEGSFDAKSREFDAVASTDRVDRDSEIINPSAFAEHLDEFKANPVMLFSHNPFIPPIGIWPKIALQKKQIPVRGKLRPEGDDELADNIARAIEGRFLRTVSIGFRIFERTDAEFSPDGKITKPAVITKAALYEISPVNVPSNVDAGIRMMKALCDDAFEKDVTRTVFAQGPSDLQVIKRAAALLKRHGEREQDGEAIEEQMLLAVRELRQHVVGLSDSKSIDFGRLRALRDLTEDVAKIKRANA